MVITQSLKRVWLQPQQTTPVADRAIMLAKQLQRRPLGRELAVAANCSEAYARRILHALEEQGRLRILPHLYPCPVCSASFEDLKRLRCHGIGQHRDDRERFFELYRAQREHDGNAVPFYKKPTISFLRKQRLFPHSRQRFF